MWSPHGPCNSIRESEEWMAGILRSSENDHRSWAINLVHETAPEDTIGIISLLLRNHAGRKEPMGWELGYLFRPQAWGKGFATEACGAAIESLRRDLNGKRGTVKAATDISNKKSLRVLAKLGFKFDEHKVFGGPQRFLGGEWRPHEIMWFTRSL